MLMKVSRMKIERMKRDIEQIDIAKRIGCTNQYVSLIELLERNPADKFKKGLEEIFGLPADELLKEI